MGLPQACSGLMYSSLPRSAPASVMRGLAGRLGDAEVGELHVALERDQDVLRADVAVDDQHGLARARPSCGARTRGPSRPGSTISTREVERHAQARARVARRRMVRRSRPVHVLHGDVVALVDLAEVEDLDDVRVGEAGDHLGLVDEHVHEFLVVREVGQDALDRHHLLEPLDARCAWPGTPRPCRPRPPARAAGRARRRGCRPAPTGAERGPRHRAIRARRRGGASSMRRGGRGAARRPAYASSARAARSRPGPASPPACGPAAGTWRVRLASCVSPSASSGCRTERRRPRWQLEDVTERLASAGSGARVRRGRRRDVGRFIAAFAGAPAVLLQHLQVVRGRIRRPVGQGLVR